MEISFDILESNSEILKAVLDIVTSELNSTIVSSRSVIENEVRELVADAIVVQPEWGSLKSGQLLEEFGLTDAQSKLTSILNTMMDSLTIDFKPFRSTGTFIRGSYKLQIVKGDFSDILSLDAAQQLTSRGQELAWLEWLLLAGDKVIVVNYDVGYGLVPGRAGGKVMLQGTGNWRVPAQFSGTEDANFITRAIDGKSSEFEQIFIRELT